MEKAGGAISPAFSDEKKPRTMNHVIAKPYAKRRYSNATINSGLFTELPATDDRTDLPSDYYSSSDSTFNWNEFLSGIMGLGNTFVSSFWNSGAEQRANYTNELYKQEQRTNTILWVVIGLILALGVFLVIRKTK